VNPKPRETAAHIKTELPGPKARALIARDGEVVSPSYPRDYPFVMSHGRGVEAWDVDGNRFLDFAAGIAVCTTGHAHPEIVSAVREAAGEFLHISSDYWHERMVALAERLVRLAPMGEPAMSFFCQSGTEAVEGAIKLARYVTGRQRFIGFLGGFHGRTMGALAFTSSKYTQQQGFPPTMPGVVHVPFPNPYRPLFVGPDQGSAVLDYIRMLFARSVPASEVAAIIVEPIQGEGGYLIPPPGFLAGLRSLCDEHGILLVFDEVQTGMGRTGVMFACEHEGVSPDPVACAAAIATLDLVEREYAANAAAIGGYFMARLRELARDYPCIGDLRGRGLMIGMELVEPGGSPASSLCDALITRAFHNGLLLLSCGVSTVRFMPPLSVTRAEVDEAMPLLRAALDQALAGAAR
jgi:4-aminobutyrate aminotransferase